MSIQFAGGTIVNTTFVPTNKATLQSNIVTQLTNAGWSQATGPSGGGSNTVTITIASPGVVTLTAHGLLANDQVVFSTTGALPTGLTAGTVYYVKTVVSSSTFTVSSSAGGTVINTSGSQSGTQSIVGCVRMQSASTPWSVSMRLRLADNGGNCITFSIEDGSSLTVGGNSTSFGCQINPGSGSTTYRIIADKYQGFVFQAVTTPSRGFVGFGTLYIPTFLQGVLTQCAWMSGNMQTDTDTTARISFRTSPKLGGPTNSQSGYFQAIANTSLIDMGNASPFNADFCSGAPYLTYPVFQSAGFVTSQAGELWHDSSALMFEPLMAWGNNIGTFSNSTGGAANTQPLIRGQLWDAVTIANQFAGDTTTTFDSHNWWNIMDSDTTDMMSLFIAVT